MKGHSTTIFCNLFFFPAAGKTNTHTQAHEHRQTKTAPEVNTEIWKGNNTKYTKCR